MTDSTPRDKFMANGLRIVDECCICLEPFDSAHVPVHFSSPRSCRHVFGQSCLQQWLLSTNENANKCPTCRHILYRQDLITEADDDSAIGFVEMSNEEIVDPDWDDYESDTDTFPGRVEDITNPEQAFEFMKYLQAKLWEFQEISRDTDDTSDEALWPGIEMTFIKFDMFESLPVPEGLKIDMSEVAHEMMAQGDIITEDKMRRHWVPIMGAVVGWRLERTGRL